MIFNFDNVAILWARLLIWSTSTNQISSQIKYQHGQWAKNKKHAQKHMHIQH